VGNRPLYENQVSLKNEADTALAVEKAWGADLIKLSMKNKIDFLLKNKTGKPRAFIEIKNRTCNRGQYPTYMLSLDKWVAGLSLQLYTQLPFILVVSWADEIGYVKCLKTLKDTTIDIGGRVDRGDAQDIEPVIHIPIHLFETLVVPHE